MVDGEPGPFAVVVKTSSIKKPDWLEALRRDRARCVYCGFGDGTFDQHVQLTIDHIIPGKRGNKSHTVDNLAVACFACNAAKGRDDPSNGALVTAGIRREEMIAIAKERIRKIRERWRASYERMMAEVGDLRSASQVI